MDHKDVKAFQDALELKQKQLDLIAAIDEIRDCAFEPGAMLSAIVDLLAERLEADFCLLYLLEGEAGQAELRAASDRGHCLALWQPAISAALVEEASRLEKAVAWDGCQKLALDAAEAVQLAAAPVVVGAGKRLGALLLGRLGAPFGEGELQLLVTAEDQIDSAVIQGFVYRKHLQAVQEVGLRRRELQLVTAIDEIRDAASDPAAMLSSIADLLAERLEADFCLIFLLDRESGAIELRAASDRSRWLSYLPRAAIRQLAEQAVHLEDAIVWEGRELLPLQSTAGAPQNVQLAVAPIVVGENQRLGALLLGRSQAPFSKEDVLLLKTAENQIDSAVALGYLQNRHESTANEIETIYQVDQIRDQDLSLDDMLGQILQVLIDRISAEMGFIMLYDRTGKQLERRATTHEDLFQIWGYCEVVEQTVQQALEMGKLVCRNDLQGALHSVMCLPLILNDQIIGVLGAVNRHGPQGFLASDCRMLKAIGSQIDTAIYERREIRHLRSVLGRSIDPRVMERLLASPDIGILRPERLELTVLYSDLRGSTSLAEQIEPEVLVEFIKDYLGSMADVILAHEGTVDKFVGDEVMALFGAPMPQEDHALRAVRVGLEMQAAYQSVMASWQARGVDAPPIGVGIATGRMIAGEMGSPQRSEYTVIGREANLGSRICEVARGGQVLVSQSTYDLVRSLVEAVPLPGQRFKGVAQEVTVYEIKRIRGGL
ncbi:MAG: GAF domain-containing protein [Anaerolineales bacterium]|nr:GAF domain-containing protein [Anaerolineales bacterium]